MLIFCKYVFFKLSFCSIKKDSGIAFPDMMFFDDERDHLSEVAHTCLGTVYF